MNKRSSSTTTGGIATEVWLRITEVALIASPALFAISTLGPVYRLTLNLGLGYPLLVAELVVILCTLGAGTTLMSALVRCDSSTRYAILLWLIPLIVTAALVARQGETARLLLGVSVLHAAFALFLFHTLTKAWAAHSTRIVSSIGIGAGVFCVVVYAFLLSMRHSEGFDWLHVGAGVSNVRHLGYFGLTSFAVGLGLMRAQDIGPVARYRDFALVCVGSGMCFWSGGRAAAGAMLISTILAFWMAGRGNRRTMLVRVIPPMLVGALLSMIWIPEVHYGLPRILGLTQQIDLDFNAYSSNRLTLWIDTARAILERPWFGYGLGQFKFVVASAQMTYAHPHNSVLQFLFQWGMAGTIAIVVMSRSALAESFRILRRGSDIAGSAAVCLLCAHLAMSLLDGNLFYTYPVFVVVTALALLSAASARQGAA